MTSQRDCFQISVFRRAHSQQLEKAKDAEYRMGFTDKLEMHNDVRQHWQSFSLKVGEKNKPRRRELKFAFREVNQFALNTVKIR